MIGHRHHEKRDRHSQDTRQIRHAVLWNLERPDADRHGQHQQQVEYVRAHYGADRKFHVAAQRGDQPGRELGEWPPTFSTSEALK